MLITQKKGESLKQTKNIKKDNLENSFKEVKAFKKLLETTLEVLDDVETNNKEKNVKNNQYSPFLELGFGYSKKSDYEIAVDSFFIIKQLEMTTSVIVTGFIYVERLMSLNKSIVNRDTIDK